MIRVKTGAKRKNRHKKILSMAKGFRGSNSKLFRTVNQKVLKSNFYSYSDRKKNKRFFRTLWIIRINIASRIFNLSYNKILNYLKKNSINLNKKILSEIILKDFLTFKKFLFD